MPSKRPAASSLTNTATNCVSHSTSSQTITARQAAVRQAPPLGVAATTNPRKPSRVPHSWQNGWVARCCQTRLTTLCPPPRHPTSYANDNVAALQSPLASPPRATDRPRVWLLRVPRPNTRAGARPTALTARQIADTSNTTSLDRNRPPCPTTFAPATRRIRRWGIVRCAEFVAAANSHVPTAALKRTSPAPRSTILGQTW